VADKSRYEKLQDAMEDVRCRVCSGTGKLEEIKGVTPENWNCPSCEGSGVAGNISVMIATSWGKVA